MCYYKPIFKNTETLAAYLIQIWLLLPFSILKQISMIYKVFDLQKSFGLQAMQKPTILMFVCCFNSDGLGSYEAYHPMHHMPESPTNFEQDRGNLSKNGWKIEFVVFVYIIDYVITRCL